MAAQFEQIDSNATGALYALTGFDGVAPQGWSGFYVTGTGLPSAITVAAAWNANWRAPVLGVNGGIYVVAPRAPAAGLLARLQSLIATLNQRANKLAYRYILWIADPDSSVGVSAAQSLAFAQGSDVNSGTVTLQANIALRNFVLMVNNNTTLRSSDGAAIRVVQFNNAVGFSQRIGTPVQIGTVTGDATLSVADPAATALGTVAMPMTMTTAGVVDDLANLRTGAAFATGKDNAYRELFGTVLAKETQQRVFTLAARLNPLFATDPAVTAFVFTGLSTGARAPRFACGYYTDMGKKLLLEPKLGAAALSLQPDRRLKTPDNNLIDAYYATPSGRFYVRLADKPDAPPPGEIRLSCGLSPTETIGLVPSGAAPADMLVFFPGQPSFAPLYPLPSVNLNDPDSNLGREPLLGDFITTAYLSAERAPVQDDGTALPPNPYYAQGKGAPLYADGGASSALDGDTAAITDYFLTRAATISASDAKLAVPLFPYLGTAPGGGPYDMPQKDIAPFEATIIAPFRKHRVFDGQTQSGQHLRLARVSDAADPIPATTPQGLLATVAGPDDPRWLSLLLGRNEDGGKTFELQFRDVDPVLQSAFQTNEQFLVITEPQRPWELGGVGSGTKTVFDNVMSIMGWPFQVNVGTHNVPGDYRNVMIFKFAKGKLSDLAATPAAWTNAGEFNAQGPVELALVSQWLQNYIAEARAMASAGEGDFLRNFLTIIDDPTWNGILILKTDVLLQQFPEEIKGLIAGIKLDQFFAHHLGVNVNFVSNANGKVEVAGNSSIFGLVDYTDPAYAGWIAMGGDPTVPVTPQPGVYDFIVLTLKVLFENSAIQNFQSRVQVTLNNWFGDEVAATPGSEQATTAPTSNSIMLDGAYEDHGGTSVFTFSSSKERMFTLGSNVLGAVDVVRADFQTMTTTGGDSDKVSARFVFSGYMNFRPVPGFDLYSFGSDWTTGDPDPGQGLFFSNLYLHMSFDLSAPTVRTFVFDAGQITFNMQMSRARPLSLYPNFPLSVSGLIAGDPDRKPDQLGYLPVSLGSSAAPLTGLGEGWWGLACTFDFGTAGDLAGQAGLVATLLLAWSPRSGKVGNTVSGLVGLKLPGAGGGDTKLLSLQGVFKLSVGDIELDIGETDEGGQAYLMKLSQIALKFFGISFPPSGNTVVFLFGDPARGGSESRIGWYAAYNRTVPPPTPPAPPGPPPPPKPPGRAKPMSAATLPAPSASRFTDVPPALLAPISRAGLAGSTQGAETEE